MPIPIAALLAAAASSAAHPDLCLRWRHGACVAWANGGSHSATPNKPVVVQQPHKPLPRPPR